ncbi:MAG: heme-binding protein [Pseudomonadota bacterium]|nr:heme-binding protein [Pseudomonadota bacterium]
MSVNKKTTRWILILLTLFLVGCGVWGPVVSNVEQPKYKVIKADGDIELRQYEPMIIATVTVKGDRKEAINEGFRVLADYIFGNNTTASKLSMTAPVSQSTSSKIDMTAPVTQKQSEKIPMTSPVTQKQSENIAMTAPVVQKSAKIKMTAPVSQKMSGNTWDISFVMPSEYTLETLPKPNNSMVKISKLPASTFAVISFSGFSSDTNISNNEKKLIMYLEQNKLQALSQPEYAFYNPPWTLPFLRRNEILIQTKK